MDGKADEWKCVLRCAERNDGVRTEARSRGRDCLSFSSLVRDAISIMRKNGIASKSSSFLDISRSYSKDSHSEIWLVYMHTQRYVTPNVKRARARHSMISACHFSLGFLYMYSLFGFLYMCYRLFVNIPSFYIVTCFINIMPQNTNRLLFLQKN